MIGCVAKAAGDAIHADPEEMEEVRWVRRADVLAAVAAAAAPDNPYYGAPWPGPTLPHGSYRFIIRPQSAHLRDTM
jgi:hypothetical protein